MSVLAFAPWAQPVRQGPRFMQAARPSYSRERMALSEGHQCHPSFSKPEASVFPVFPSGSGGNGGSWYGGAGGPPPPRAQAPHHPIVEREVGFKGLVVDRPVLTPSVLSLRSKIAGREPWEMRRPQDGAPAHRVEHQRRDFRILLVAGVVGCPPAHVRAG